MAELKDANTNPWYVLMTLYGEQEGEYVDQELAEKNRRVWNAWSCQGVGDDQAEKLAKLAQVEVIETRGWEEISTDVKKSTDRP